MARGFLNCETRGGRCFFCPALPPAPIGGEQHSRWTSFIPTTIIYFDEKSFGSCNSGFNLINKSNWLCSCDVKMCIYF